MVKKVWQTDRRTDGRTDGQTDGLNQWYSCLIAAKKSQITKSHSTNKCHLKQLLVSGRWRSACAWDNDVQKVWRTYHTARMSRTPTGSGAQLSWTRRPNLRTRLFRALHAFHALHAVDAGKVKRRSRHGPESNAFQTDGTPHACHATPTEVGSQLLYPDRSWTCNAGNARHAMHALHTDHAPKCIRIGRRQRMAPSNVGMSGTSRMSRAARISRATGVPQAASWGSPPVSVPRSVPGLPLRRTRPAMHACNTLHALHTLHACHALRNRRQPQKSAPR